MENQEGWRTGEPETVGNYICTVVEKSVSNWTAESKVGVLFFDGAYWRDADYIIYKGNVTAWRPLPQPYRGEG